MSSTADLSSSTCRKGFKGSVELPSLLRPGRFCLHLTKATKQKQTFKVQRLIHFEVELQVRDGVPALPVVADGGGADAAAQVRPAQEEEEAAGRHQKQHGGGELKEHILNVVT